MKAAAGPVEMGLRSLALVCFKGEMLTGQLSGCAGPGFRGKLLLFKKEAILCLQISFKPQSPSYRNTKRPTCINPSRKYGKRTGLSSIDVLKSIVVLKSSRLERIKRKVKHILNHI